jgi:hypothetical protein
MRTSWDGFVARDAVRPRARGGEATLGAAHIESEKVDERGRIYRITLRMLEPIRKPGEGPSFCELDLPRLQAEVARRVGMPRRRVH